MSENEKSQTTLKRTLGPIMLWGLGVGYVISGMYFGWNLGLAKGGTLGLAIATGFIIVMYLTFTFGYTELACAIPKAGGAFDYAKRALGSRLGFIGGMAQNIEFIFAPPAIAFAIGAYFQQWFPEIHVLVFAVAAYLLFTGINIAGVEAAATFELVVTAIAVIGLLIFAGTALPHFEFAKLEQNALPFGIQGVFAAIPFAIWFFLAIEGVANVAEETINPQRNVLIGFGSAILTLVILCLLTFASSIGVNGWETAVLDGTGSESDAPLPMVIEYLLGKDHLIYHIIVTIGLFGLVASFHGIILAAGRSSYEFGRVGYAPRWIGKISSKTKAPTNALIINMLIGIVALMTGKTGEIITIACFGALTLYIISMVSLLVLRKKEPDLERPFKVPFFPLFPIVSLSIASFSLIAITIYNWELALVYLGIMILSFLWFILKVEPELKENQEEQQFEE